MNLEKQIIHLYEGDISCSIPCAKCNKNPHSIVHIKNGGTVCDAIDWACACGSWHEGGEMSQKIHMANTNYSEWLRKVSTPGYNLTQDDKDILEALES